MTSSAILPLHPVWTGCDNRTCGDQSRCFDCEGCLNFALEEKARSSTEAIDGQVRLLAKHIKTNIDGKRLQVSEARRISVLLLGELEKLNET